MTGRMFSICPFCGKSSIRRRCRLPKNGKRFVCATCNKEFVKPDLIELDNKRIYHAIPKAIQNIIDKKKSMGDLKQVA